MIDDRVVSRAGGETAAILYGLAGIALLLLALLAGSPHPGILSILPFALAVVALKTVESSVAFTITEEGLEFEEPPIGLVRYSEVGGITAPVARDPSGEFAIQLYHPTGVVRIPREIDFPSRSLYDFLVERLPPIDPPDPDHVAPGLRTFLVEQINLFGPEKVFVYHSRPFPPKSANSRKFASTVAVICVGLAWCVIGIAMKSSKNDDGAVWAGFGCMFSFIALLFVFILARSSSLRRPGNWRNSSVIVSPGGLALVQGALRGKMRWDELRAIDYPARPRFAVSSHGGARSGLGLLTDGAFIIIGDFYQRPLTEIRRTVHDYWGGRDANR